ncbi:hypothetical protein SAMN02910325_03441 [Ruminococcus flavefaciens]|uniref:Uncharacterized protein n=1 Tax=Ruminococcus flavefaciens TaxID=1265 RepID=A0A315YFL0_RUMFL|nr:hypothetical protein IE37_03441 [Ruminococcus flavefaciens]SSA52287.1 hypothetical protein SAMN02910325_03441 [Ruminococcus flavefaciens]
MRELSLTEITNIRKVLTCLTVILSICAISMRFFGIYPKFNTISFVLLGVFSILCFAQKKDNNYSNNFFLASLIVGDAAYLLSLFFLLGRSFISKF